MTRTRRGLLTIAALLATGLGPGARAADIAVRGSELVVAVDGVPRPSTDLIGATLTLSLADGRAVDVRIDRLGRDPHIPEGDVFLYDLSVKGDDGAWTPVCDPEGDGAPHAILQPTTDGRIAIFCTAGALGKCIRFGYRPWATRNGRKLDAYWRTCVKMVRGDYCGDDQPTTRDNMLIDYYDRLGIARRDGKPGLTFEAAWDEHGAVCVSHPRVPQNVTLKRLARTCPRLRGRLGAACSEATVDRFGTPLLMDASRGDGVPEKSGVSPATP